MNWNALNDVQSLRDRITQLRQYVTGCEFAHASEAFKDIEGCKVRIAWLERHVG